MKREQKVCKTCRFYHGDYGIWCVNGWSRDGSTGECGVLPTRVYAVASGSCMFWEEW